MSTLHAVLPAGVDDPDRPSGGNVYDRQVCAGLVALGWTVIEHATTLTVPDAALTLVDGLVAGRSVVTESARLHVVVLVHMPRGPEDPDEWAVLAAAARVVTTSRWTRRRLLEWYGLDPDRVRVVEPGVEPAPLAPGSEAGSALLAVGAVTPLKGYDVLEAALALVADLEWTCCGVGSLAVEPAFASTVGAAVRLTGPQTPAELDATYAEADLLVLASRAETYGMVVTEALARGLPVVASDVGGVREAVRHAGVLVPPEDPVALAAALRTWLTDPDHRERLRTAARARRTQLGDWGRTTVLLAGVLREAQGEVAW